MVVILIKKLQNIFGFTIIEIIVTLAIISILAASIIPSCISYIDKTNEKTCQISRDWLMTHYHSYKNLMPNASYDHFLAAENFGSDVSCPSGGIYKYDIELATGKERIQCSIHGGHFYNFYYSHQPDELATSAKSGYTAFLDYYEYAVANGLTSKSISALTYNMGLKRADGDEGATDQCTKFWNGVMALTDLTLTDLDNISDNKFFAAYNDEGQRTNTVNAVFYKIGSRSVMYFAATDTSPEAYYVSYNNWTAYPVGVDRFDRKPPLNPDGTLMEGFEVYTP